MNTIGVECDFVREYVPPVQGPETELHHHLKQCPECRDQAVVVRNAS